MWSGDRPVLLEIAGTAENGRDAWNLIQREKPDLVFMDIHMPYMNGFEIIQKMKDASKERR